MRTFLLAILATILTVSWQSSHAKMAIAFDDPDTQGIDLLIVDGGPYDLDDVPGVIEFCGETPPLLVCAIGISTHAEGTATVPQLSMNINFIRYTGGQAGCHGDRYRLQCQRRNRFYHH